MTHHEDKLEEPGDERLDAATKAADAVDARTEPGADREPTEEEEQAAENAAPVDDEVAEAYEEAARTGAELEGEGAVEAANDGIEPLST